MNFLHRVYTAIQWHKIHFTRANVIFIAHQYLLHSVCTSVQQHVLPTDKNKCCVNDCNYLRITSERPLDSNVDAISPAFDQGLYSNAFVCM